jgi:glycolate oxidase
LPTKDWKGSNEITFLRIDAMLDERIKKELIDIVGLENFTEAKIDMVSYAYDAMGSKGRPDCAVWVTSTEEISRIMQLASREKIPVTPRAAGTSIAGMVVPTRGGIVLDVMRMDRILEINVEDRVCVVEPGVVYADLQKALAPLGFTLPTEPGSSIASAIGGNVATNAGGLKGAKYGTTKDYVLGLKVVLPDGRIMKTGTRTMKTSSGYNLTQLFVGSEGTLGIMTEIILKIVPLAKATATGLGLFDSLEDAGRAVTQTMSSGVIPSVMEVMGRYLIQAINENTDLNLPDVDTMLLVETDGYTQTEADAQMDKVIEIFKRNKASEVQMAKSAEERADLWAARKSTHPVAARLNNSLVVEDVTVPMSRLADLFREFGKVIKKYNLKVAMCAHAGDGNFHPLIAFDRRDQDMVEKVEKANDELFEMTIAMGGTLSGEHGIGTVKAKYMPLEHDETAMDMMRTIKRAFDPHNILNPGKMALDG